MVDPNVVIKFLNELVVRDPDTMKRLVNSRVVCSSELADHPTVQTQEGDYGTPVVGLLGILNGLCGSDKYGQGFIMAVFDDNEDLTGFIHSSTWKCPDCEDIGTPFFDGTLSMCATCGGSGRVEK